MIFFFGTRPGKTESKQLLDVKCPHCEQSDTLTVAMTSNWFHLFWIKVFKLSWKKIAECSHCKRVYFQEEFSEAMQKAINPM